LEAAALTRDVGGGSIGNIYDSIDDVSGASQNYMPESASEPTFPPAPEPAAASFDVDNSVYIHPPINAVSDQSKPGSEPSDDASDVNCLEELDVGESASKSTYLTIAERDEEELPVYAQLDSEIEQAKSTDSKDE